MFLLHLVFVLALGSAAEPPQFRDHYVSFAMLEECERERRWWIENQEAELPGMRQEWRLLIMPLECQAAGPLVS